MPGLEPGPAACVGAALLPAVPGAASLLGEWAGVRAPGLPRGEGRSHRVMGRAGYLPPQPEHKVGRHHRTRRRQAAGERGRRVPYPGKAAGARLSATRAGPCDARALAAPSAPSECAPQVEGRFLPCVALEADAHPVCRVSHPGLTPRAELGGHSWRCPGTAAVSCVHSMWDSLPAPPTNLLRRGAVRLHPCRRQPRPSPPSFEAELVDTGQTLRAVAVDPSGSLSLPAGV